MIVLTILLFLSLALLVVVWAIAHKIDCKAMEVKRENKELKAQIWRLNESTAERTRFTAAQLRLSSACLPDEVSYTIKDSLPGYVKVCKEVGDMESIIKLYTDTDYEYNRRCAEELLEKLNEK